MYKFVDLQNQVKRGATKDQGGSQFTTWIKDVINESLFTISRDTYWRQLRRITSFNTVGDYTTGTIAVGAGASTWTGTGVDWMTNLQVGRRFQTTGSGGSSKVFTIASITPVGLGDGTIVTTEVFDGSSNYSGTYKVFGKFEYVLPVQLGRIGLMTHRQYGFTYRMRYITDFDYYNTNVPENYSYVPNFYREWGMDMVLEQPKIASVISVSSSSSADVSIDIIVFGIVSGYPDSETITTNVSNGTTVVAGSKSFTTIERVSKSASTIGRITITANSAATTVAVIPTGNTMAGILYKKIQLWPYPNAAFPVTVEYYKDPARLVGDNDIHELGSDFDEAIVLLSVARIKYEQSQLADGDKFISLYKNQLDTLRKKNTDKADYLPILKKPNEYQASTPLLHPHLEFLQAGGAYGPSSRT